MREGGVLLRIEMQWTKVSINKSSLVITATRERRLNMKKTLALGEGRNKIR